MDPLLIGAVNVLFAMQTVQASLVGTVTDGATGEPLAGAAVVLGDVDRAVFTDTRGSYTLHDVPAGPQHVTVRVMGYAERTLHALVPREGEVRINISLRPEPVPLGILEVRPPIAFRDAENGSMVVPERGISMAAVRNHPLLGEPDVFGALASGAVLVQPEAPSGLHIRGGSSDQTAYLIEGIPVFSPYHAASVFSAWNPDALSRLHVSSASPSPAYPDALSGAVSAVTRPPGARHQGRGSVSTSQVRVTADGPLGPTGGGYLLSLRSGFPGLMEPKEDPSYLRGETHDWLAKLELPAFGGELRLLSYASDDEVSAAAGAEDALDPAAARNEFEWESHSLGAQWTRAFSTVTVRVQGWSARGDVGSVWGADSIPASMTASRYDEGVSASVERRAAENTTVAGLRLERSRTSYFVITHSSPEAEWRLKGTTPLATAFLQHSTALGEQTVLDLGTSLTATGGGVHFGPRAQLRWDLSQRLEISGSFARLHQFAQSLRNPESVASHIFPADLYIGAGASGVPVARSNQGVIGLDYRPLPNVRLSTEVYERDFGGLLLVAPRESQPFAAGDFAVGSGMSRGVSLDAAASSDRYGVVASYGWQRVRLAYGDSSYVPDHGTTHRLHAGLVVFPTATWSIRVGVTGAMGRRTTSAVGGFEWEACNLRDRGCEFAGSPPSNPDALGATALPTYLRGDVGLRKHWHREILGRDTSVALFGTVTNVFSRNNVLTYAVDPVTGERDGIDMRPLAPLVVGIDWGF